MIITCPVCLTKFNLDEERIPEGGAKGRCIKCQHIFSIPKPTSPEPKPSPWETIPPKEPEKVSIPISRKIEMPPPRERQIRRYLLYLIIILLLLGGIGYGLYWLENDPSAQQKILASISSLRNSLGLGEGAEGLIVLEKVRGYYLENKNLAKIFVVEGQAVNQWKEPRSLIKVKGTLLDDRGGKVEEKTSYCGNIILEEDLKVFSREAIEKSLSSQFGQTFSNVNIPPGKSVPFMIVFTAFSSGIVPGKPDQQPATKAGESPPKISDFSVEVVSSQKGSGG